MKKENTQSRTAETLSILAKKAITSAANSRCAFVYHQPVQPMELKKFRKF